MNTFPTTILPDREIIQKISGKMLIADRFFLNEVDKETIKSFFHDNAKESFYYYLKTFKGAKRNGTSFYFRDNALINALDSKGKCNIASTEDSLTEHILDPTSSSYTFASDYLYSKGTLLCNMQYDGDGDYLKIYNSKNEIFIKIKDGLLVISAKSQVSDEVITRSIQVKSKSYFWTNQQYNYICFALSYVGSKIILAHNNTSISLNFKQDLNTDSLNLDIYKNIYDFVISEYESDEEFLKGFSDMIGDEIVFTFSDGSVVLSQSAEVYLQSKERIQALFSQEQLQPELRGTNYDIKIKLQEV